MREAQVLLRAGEWSGAYYLAGYSVECALKARIARQVRSGEFPDKHFANKVWIHKLSELVKLCDLDAEFAQAKVDRRFEQNWTIVIDWSENSRYEIKAEQEARDLLSAVTARKYAVLPWIRRHW